jgi:flagellar protein FliJ
VARNARTLQRIGRVRTLQLTLAHADEVRARAQVDTETQLADRVAALAAAVAPAAATASGGSLIAAAHFRGRLHQTAETVAARVRQAEQAATAAAAATRAARQDQGAVDKLIERARALEAAAERRALEDLPALPTKRHGSC